MSWAHDQKQAAGVRTVKPFTATGMFDRNPDEPSKQKVLPEVNKGSLRFNQTDSLAEYALVPPPPQPLARQPQALEGEFIHVPGYSGHKPLGWCSHINREDWGKHEQSHSKRDAHVAMRGRPAMDSGVGFKGNTRLSEGPPKYTSTGLFKADIVDEIDRIAQWQVKQIGSTAYEGLKQKSVNATIGADPATSVTHSSTNLLSTLRKDPPGTRLQRAAHKDLAIFQGEFPASRQISGYDGHIPGGVRR